jgi:hypothetical protein
MLNKVEWMGVWEGSLVSTKSPISLLVIHVVAAAPITWRGNLGLCRM